MFKNLCELLNTQVIKGEITTNGNCFLHALEYALRNGDIGSHREDLFNKTRREVASFAIQKIKSQKRKLLAEFKQVERNEEEMTRFYDAFDERIHFLQDFKTNKEYSNEDIIYYAALYKQVNLCIVEEEGPHRMALISPNLPLTSKNTLFFVHSNGNHYNTFEYPIHVSSELLYALKHLQAPSEFKEYTITIKDFILEDLMKKIVSNRINRRKTENLLLAQSLAKGTNQSRTLRQIKTQTLRSRKNHNLARSLAKGTNQHKLYKLLKTPSQVTRRSVKPNKNL